MELLVDPSFSPGSVLCEEESRHCVKVMRHREGDTVYVTDGQGQRFECRLVKADARGCLLDVVTTEVVPTFHHMLHMAVAPTKNIDRFEWFVEKAVEIGVCQITPIICDHSERTTLRLDRLERVATAAAKQSLKCHLPNIGEPISCAKLIEQATEQQRFILHCVEDAKRHLYQACAPGQSTLVLIGPEGDFSTREIELAKEHGFEACTLGEQRLRTETAAMVATNIVNLAEQLMPKI